MGSQMPTVIDEDIRSHGGTVDRCRELRESFNDVSLR
jgi:hypothetical protein